MLSLVIMTFSIPSDCRKFKPAVAPLFICTFVLAALGGFAFVLMLDGSPFEHLALAVASAVVPVAALLLAWVFSFFFPVSFSGDGIYGHSFWGRQRLVRWQDIGSAQPFTLLNLHWLRIYTRDYSAVTWLALFQSHNAEFQQELRRLAPAGNPILKPWQ